MIDTTARQQAAALIDRFREREIEFDDVEMQWPPSTDPALEAISKRLWQAFYSDFGSLSTSGKPKISPEGLSLLSRCAAFLRSELPYEWPSEEPGILASIRRRLQGEDLTGTRAVQSDGGSRGDPDQWPFYGPLEASNKKEP
jgi:hypothetical protein